MSRDGATNVLRGLLNGGIRIKPLSQSISITPKLFLDMKEFCIPEVQDDYLPERSPWHPSFIRSSVRRKQSFQNFSATSLISSFTIALIDALISTILIVKQRKFKFKISASLYSISANKFLFVFVLSEICIDQDFLDEAFVRTRSGKLMLRYELEEENGFFFVTY